MVEKNEKKSKSKKTTARSTWKGRERKIASYFGSQRTPLSGGNSGHTRSDSLHKELFVEAKLRVKHSAVTLWDDTAVLAKKEKKIPVVCLAEKGRKGFWVLVQSKDLRKVSEFVEDETRGISDLLM